MTTIEPCCIAIPGAVLDDLSRRLSATRWPAREPLGDWQLGTDGDYLRALVEHWLNEFDWRSTERRLNDLPQFATEIDGTRIHFIHHRAASGRGKPILLSHGWPSAFIENLPVMDLLGDDFDVVVPSLPGYGLSERPKEVGVNYRRIAGPDGQDARAKRLSGQVRH